MYILTSKPKRISEYSGSVHIVTNLSIVWINVVYDLQDTHQLQIKVSEICLIALRIFLSVNSRLIIGYK
jgi:hypothetical protein